MQSSYHRDGNNWIFDDGTILPVISGGSDTWVPSEIPGLGESSNEEDEYTISEFAQGILNQIPEEDRPVMQKHLKTWDGNVTKKFQEYSGKLKPYEELGTPEELQQAITWISMLNDDPVTFIDNIQKALKEIGHPAMTDTNNDEEITLPEFEGIPQEFVKKYQTMEQQLTGISSKFEDFMKQQELKEASNQFDNLMKEMHTQHGDFDEDWMLVQMQKGISPQDAISKWNKEVVEKYSSQRKSAPKILSGTGAVPSPSQADISKMTTSERKALAVQMLMAANGKET